MMDKKFGLTGPISVAGPTPEEIARNDAMLAELRAQNSFEGPAETALRKRVLAVMDSLAKEFVYRVSLQKNLSEGMARDAGGKIFTFGSYRLGVYGPGSDIDTLVVVPKHVTRASFFDVMAQLLRERPELDEIQPVPEAFVPIIKIKFSGISIDLICARLDRVQIPESLTLEDNMLLRNIDEKDSKALNGPRVTDAILSLVPEKTTFRHALRVIKLWAQSRAIYANIMGFPGGVAWAMLVARVCQLFPAAVAAVIVDRFFEVYMRWPWPSPVLLTKIEDGPVPMRVWNPKIYPQDHNHKMPIITPAFPSMCATHNVTESTKEVIKRELARGQQIMEGIKKGERPWSDLFQKSSFFFDYHHYMCVYASTKSNQEDHLAWSGFVESRLRFMVQKLEVTDGIELVHPFNKPFELSYAYKTNEEARAIADGYPKGPPLPAESKKSEASAESAATAASAEATNAETSATNAETANAETANAETASTEANATTAATSTNAESKPAESTEPTEPTEPTESKDADAKPDTNQKIIHSTLLFLGLEYSENRRMFDLQTACTEFANIIESWPAFDPQKYSLALRVLPAWQLPDCVFREGETRPQRPRKRKRAAR